MELARRADQENPEIRLNLAYALSRVDRMTEAIAELEIAVRLAPADSGIRLFLGNLFVLTNEKSRAAEQYTKLKQMDPIAAARSTAYPLPIPPRFAVTPLRFTNAGPAAAFTTTS